MQVMRRTAPTRLECSDCAVGLASGVGCARACPFVERTLRAGDIVFSHGEAADRVWFVRGGTVVLARASDGADPGRLRAHAVRFPGSFVGLEVLVSPVYLDTATAATDVSLCGAERGGVDAWLGARGTPARTALEVTLRADALDRPREAPSDGSAVGRLARWLLHAVPSGASTGVPRNVIADLLGMRAETLSRALAELARRGAIELTRTTLRILDEGALAAAAGRAG